jgi:hypothetical protein
MENNQQYLSRGYRCDLPGCHKSWHEGQEHSFDGGATWLKLCKDHEEALVGKGSGK